VPIWKPRAEADLWRYTEYYAQEDPHTAWRILGKVLDRAQLLDAQPGLGRAGRVKGTRELVLNGAPFILVYREQQKSVEILRVLHAAQKWP